MKERSFAERDVALLFRCPKCRATAENPCLNEWSSGHVETHLERIAIVWPRLRRAVEQAEEVVGAA